MMPDDFAQVAAQCVAVLGDGPPQALHNTDGGARCGAQHLRGLAAGAVRGSLNFRHHAIAGLVGNPADRLPGALCWSRCGGKTGFCPGELESGSVAKAGPK